MSNEKTYALSIYAATAEKDGEYLADLHGALPLIAFAVKGAVKALNADGASRYTAIFSETDGIGGEKVRTVTDLTANGRTVGTVLKAEMASEKKAVSVDEPIPADGTHVPAY